MDKILGIVITDGVGFRNFVLSNFFNEASKQFQKVIIYSGLPMNSYDEIELKENISLIELDIYKEKNISWFFRKLKEVAHMYQHRTFYGINNNLVRGYPKKNTKRGVLTKIIYKIASVLNSENWINFYEKLQYYSFKQHKITLGYKILLKKDKPNVLFFTHQRPPYIAPLLYAAKDQKIPTCSFIFSWDNLASKGRMMGSFDSYLVWSDLMKKELLHFYPLVNKRSIEVVGTPQFEPYIMDSYLINKATFFNKFDLDKHKKTICYSCADAGIGANDSIHIKSILNYIHNTKLHNIQLLVRTSPAEDGLRFNALKEAYPEIRWNLPKWTLSREQHVESWSQRVPTREDLIDLKSILSYCDVNVNMCSTMGLDFMLFDKSVINTVFGNESNGLYNDQRFLNYAHYKYVIESKAVTIAKNEKELHKQLEEALKNPELRKDYRKSLIKFEISKPLEGTSKRIVEMLLKISNE